MICFYHQMDRVEANFIAAFNGGHYMQINHQEQVTERGDHLSIRGYCS